MSYVKVYDQQMRLLAVLEDATQVQYHRPRNELSTGSFCLPLADPKIDFCQAHNYVEIEDPPRKPMLYRIVSEPGVNLISGKLREFTLEGAEASLLDKLIFGYHQIGGTGVDTEAVLRWLLGWQDEPKRWVLGTCDFHYQFEYKFESAHLLSALFSVSACIIDEYTWVFDTTQTPWTVSLKRASTTPSCSLIYMRNMTDIHRSMDATGLVTRLYPVGYGEGVNELHIGSVNGGVDYLDADTIDIWGVKEAVYPDKRIEDAETLKARGQAVLSELKTPYLSYTAYAVDLSRYTGQAWDMFEEGELIRVMDCAERGIVQFDARIQSIQKGDVYGAPHGIQLTIANGERDVTGAINALADRAGIMELYSQGATNMTADQFADNADPDNPFEFPLYLDSDMRRINKVLLNISIEAFRSYEKGAAAGGGSTTTSSTDGGRTVTSESGGSATVTEEQRTVTTEAVTGVAIAGRDGDTSGNTGAPLVAGVNKAETDASEGASTGNSSKYYTDGVGSDIMTGTNESQATGISSLITTDSGGSSVSTGGSGELMTGYSDDTSHTHLTDYHDHGDNGTTKVRVTVNSSTASHRHSLSSHSHTMGTHTHGMSHTHSVPGHQHPVGFHNHGMAHTHTIGDHTHGMLHYHNFSHMHNVTVAVRR